MNRRRALHPGLRLALAAAIAATGSVGATQPTKVVGFAPGGSVDAPARLVAESLQPGLGRTAIVESRTGAGGRLAAERVKAAPPDGDTLLLAPQGPMTLFPFVSRGLRYDPARDFIPVTRVAGDDFALTIGPMVPARDMKGLRAWPATAGDKASGFTPGD